MSKVRVLTVFMRPCVRRPLPGSAALVAAAALVPLLVFTSPSDAAPQTSGSLTVSTATGVPGKIITIKGKIAPYDEHRVQLQRREAGGLFATVATRQTDGEGRFTFHTTLPQDRTTGTYRVLSPQGRAGPYVTPSRNVTITGIVRITHGRGGAQEASISGDGRHVAYEFSDSKPHGEGLFLWDRRTGSTIHLPHSWAASRSALSRDGRFVVYDFLSEDVRVWDRTTGTARTVGHGEYPGISADGMYVAYSGHDLAGSWTVKVWDRATDTTTALGEPAGYCGPTLSHDGRYVTFSSGDPDLVPNDDNGNLWDIFVWDRTTGTTTRVAGGNSLSWCPHISADGRFVAFTSEAANLVPDDQNGKQDVFVSDAATGAIIRLTDGNHDSWISGISADGRYVTFSSNATDLIPGIQTKPPQVYLWDRKVGTTARLTNGNRTSRPLGISSDGRSIVFLSLASDLVPYDTKGSTDLFLWTRKTTG
jgi:Tol biopolymer transport system component